MLWPIHSRFSSTRTGFYDACAVGACSDPLDLQTAMRAVTWTFWDPQPDAAAMQAIVAPPAVSLLAHTTTNGID